MQTVNEHNCLNMHLCTCTHAHITGTPTKRGPLIMFHYHVASPPPINKWPSSPVAEEDKRTAGVGTIMQQLAQQTTDPDIQINNTSPKTPFPGRIHSQRLSIMSLLAHVSVVDTVTTPTNPSIVLGWSSIDTSPTGNTSFVNRQGYRSSWLAPLLMLRTCGCPTWLYIV